MADTDDAEQKDDVTIAREEGRLEAESELNAKYQAELAARDEAHRIEMETLRTQLLLEASDRIEARFHTIRTEIADRLSLQVTEVLLPVLGSKLADMAAADLADKVLSLFTQPDGIVLTVHGPERLFQIFNEKIAFAGFHVNQVISDDMDLTVEHNDLVLVTRISAWAEATRSLTP
jgi:hypothetical protein